LPTGLAAGLAAGLATTAGVLFLVFSAALAAGAAAGLLVLVAGALAGFAAGFTAATLVFAAGTGFAGIGDKVFAFEEVLAAATGIAADLDLVGGADGAIFWGFAADFTPGFVVDGAGRVDFGDGILQPQNKKSKADTSRFLQNAKQRRGSAEWRALGIHRQDGGRTFGLQSLRWFGLCDRCHCVAGCPEVLLSLLPKKWIIPFPTFF
jgi:hypothetical protein